jgi:hypothetical protein
MIKVGNEYLDFDDDITLERQIKLFENIATSNGDFSYAFDIPKTINNTRILAAPFPDNIIKNVYHRIESEIVSNDGVSIYNGYLRIERITDVYSCSFFAGNNNWFSLLTGSMMDLDFSEFEKEITIDTITASWNDKDGVKYPLVDLGNLSTRSENVFQLIDFMPFTFVHTLMEKIFSSVGISLSGELLADPMYKKSLIAANPNSDKAIKARTTYAGKDPFGPLTTYQLMTFPNDSVAPFFDGDNNNFNAAISRYTADVGMIVDIEFLFNFDDAILLAWQIRINGVQTTDGTFDGANIYNEDIPAQIFKNNVMLNAGDTLEIWAGAVGVTSNITSGYLKITPKTLFKTFSEQLLPNWSKQKFVSNVLRIFNIIPSYDPIHKNVTFDIFENINKKQAIDLSEYISETQVDYTEFISNYGKMNLLEYKQMTGFDEIDKYNGENRLPYGNGSIIVDNDFLDDEKQIVQSDFTAPFDYYNVAFDLPLARINVNTVQEGETITVTQVNDSSGIAEFVLGNGHGLIIGDLVRIKNSNIPAYNGDHIVSLLVSTDKVQLYNVSFIDDADLDLAKLNTIRANGDDVFIVLDTGNLPGAEAFYTSKTDIVIGLPGFIYLTDEPSLAFFNMPNVGRAINDIFTQSLAFGSINLPDRYQMPIKDIYYALFGRILNDPVKLKSKTCIPYSIFMGIDFLRPIYVKTLETVNLYYLNRMTDYQAPYKEATAELIKI